MVCYFILHPISMLGLHRRGRVSREPEDASPTRCMRGSGDGREEGGRERYNQPKGRDQEKRTLPAGTTGLPGRYYRRPSQEAQKHTKPRRNRRCCPWPVVPPAMAGTTAQRYYRPLQPVVPVPARTPDEISPLACNLPLRTPIL